MMMMLKAASPNFPVGYGWRRLSSTTSRNAVASSRRLARFHPLTTVRWSVTPSWSSRGSSSYPVSTTFSKRMMMTTTTMASVITQHLTKMGKRCSFVTGIRPRGRLAPTPILYWTSALALVMGGGCWQDTSSHCTFCQPDEAAPPTTTTLTTPLDSLSTPALVLSSMGDWIKEWAQHLRRAWRVLRRFLQLSFTLAPVVAFYPVLLRMHQRDPQADARDLVLGQPDSLPSGSGRLSSWLLERYLRLCLACVEYSGAAVIKLMQWAGSRPDLFGYEFCAVFSQLQDHTTPHAWSHTERAMRQAYGPNWAQHIALYEILGSGCIGQVYRGEILADVVESSISASSLDTTVHQPTFFFSSGWPFRMFNGPRSKDQDSSPIAPPMPPRRQVAVKVLHPSVKDDIEADLDLMRLAVRLAARWPWGGFSQLKWLDLEGVVEEFADLLQLQLDLRREGANLQRFQENFRDEPSVTVPQLVAEFAPTKEVLVETYCKGVPVLQFAREHAHDPKLLHDLCFDAIRAVCKMIFLDNFMHGDLHPGNVFVSPDGKKFILLDAGIVAEYSDRDHEAIVDILAAFIRKQGRKAGRLMIADSNHRLRARGQLDAALEEERFIDKIEALTIKASSSDYLMEHLGTYISYICNAASQHHVMMNPAFVSAALAVKVQEGIALALDPSIEIWEVAIPIIVESERRRGLVSMSRLLGLDQILPAWWPIGNNTGDRANVGPAAASGPASTNPQPEKLQSTSAN